MSTFAEIKNYNLSISETLPTDVAFMDDYQEKAFQQIAWDEQGGTIRGRQYETYMLDGLIEELDEMILDEDRVEPNYSRIGAIVMLEGTSSLVPGEVTDTSIARHLKEFGDVSWYLANYLRIFNIHFSRTVAVGAAAWNLDSISQPRSNPRFEDQNQRAFPWIYLFNATGELKEAAHALTGIPRDMRILPEQALLVASGKLVTSMIHIVKTRFGADFADILRGNQEKLNKRLENGTIFDKSGGDDR